MSSMNTNRNIPKAPPPPGLPKPGAAPKKIIVGKAKPPAPGPGPKAPAPKPGASQEGGFAAVTAGAKKPGSTLPKPPPLPGKK